MKPAAARKARGQAMVEYLIVLPALLMLVLGAIQFALLYQAKSALNHATFMAARQGAVKNAKALSIKDALAAGLTPLFTFSPDLGGLAKGRAIAMIEVFNPLTTTIEILSPTSAAADDFAADDPADSSKRLIPNDNLMYRPTSVGGSSGVNIQDANLLKIRVTYCTRLIVPFANLVTYSVVNGISGVKNLSWEWFGESTAVASTPNDCSMLKDRFGSQVAAGVADAAKFGVDVSFIQDALDTISNALSGFVVPGLDWPVGGYRIPITAEAVVRMQSPARFDK
jgi:hypothetical protein